MEERKNTIIRFGIIFFVMCLLFLAVLYKIVRTQYFERERYMAVAKSFPTGRVIEASRGNIYDCNQRLLAASVRSYLYYMDTKVEPLRAKNGKLFNDSVGALADSLSEFFGDRTKDEYIAYLTREFERGNTACRLTPRRISYAERQRLQANFPLIRLNRYKGGCYVEESYDRVNPYGSSAAVTIGHVYAENGAGSSGLEYQYNNILTGVDGYSDSYSWENIGQTGYRAPIPGKDIVTTLDAELQDFTDMALYNVMEKSQADWGCVILMEVRTGEIKAMTNLTRTTDGSYIELCDSANYAVRRVNPGSTFKPVTLMVALERGVFNINSTFSAGRYKNGQWLCSWFYQYPQGDVIVTDKDSISDHPYPSRTPNLRQALAGSSNIVFSKLLVETYNHDPKPFLEDLIKLGIKDIVPFPLPGASTALVEMPDVQTTFPRMSYGMFQELTPLQTLTFYNGVANNGKMLRPILVKSILENGKEIQHFTAEVINPKMCSDKTLTDVKNSLEDVVWDNAWGTASKTNKSNCAQSSKVRIAGKTGTARIRKEHGGGFYRDRHRISFCGYFPANNPKYSCICVISRPNEMKAGDYCGSTVRIIAEKAMAMTVEQTVEDMIATRGKGQLPSVKNGMTGAINTAMSGLSLKTSNANNGQWTSIEDDYTMTNLSVSPSVVPNVVGMGAKDAVYAIEQTGMRVQLQGVGKVVKQSVSAGSAPTTEGIVLLTLE